MDALSAQDERAARRTAKSRRPDTPTLVSSLWGTFPAGDGGNKARLTEETTKETVKPSRRECRNVRLTCGDYSCVLSLFAHKAAGAVRHPAFPAPSDSPGDDV
jgi:hypothetical protein